MQAFIHHPGPALQLQHLTAAELMTPQVQAVTPTTTFQEAAALLTEKNVGAVPVLGVKGEPIGVLSRSDVVAHLCTTNGNACQQGPTPGAVPPSPRRRRRPRVAPEPPPELTLVRDVMTPVVFSVAMGTPADCVVNALLSLSVHRVFVTDDDGSLVGVISSTDILRHLKRPAATLRDEKEVLCSADLMK